MFSSTEEQLGQIINNIMYDSSSNDLSHDQCFRWHFKHHTRQISLSKLVIPSVSFIVPFIMDYKVYNGIMILTFKLSTWRVVWHKGPRVETCVRSKRSVCISFINKLYSIHKRPSVIVHWGSLFISINIYFNYY